MDLAERVILANKEAEIEQEQDIINKYYNDFAPEGYYTDDLGFWVEQDIRKHKSRFADYVLFRCRYINHNLNVRDSEFLYNGNRLIYPNANGVSRLADLPEKITEPIAAWVYKRLCQTSPRFNSRRIEILPGVLWDYDKLDIVEMSNKKYKTVN